MNRFHRVLLLATAALVGATTVAGGAAVERRVRGLRVLEWDLKGKAGVAAATSYQQVRSLLMYAEPDVVALHNARGEAKGASKEGSPLAALAQSLGMYYAFAPEAPGADVGGGLLSRYPIRSSKPLTAEAPKGSLAGMQAEIEYMRRITNVILVRPENEDGSKAATAAVAKLVSADQQGAYVILGSWDSAADAEAAVKEWQKAGLVEAGAELNKKTPATYPQAKPTERLEYVLVSQNLRRSVRGVELVRHPAVKAISDRLPLEVTLARMMAALSRERRPR
jgi:endonuclease/exonuclease/phosphatase family metal-dependent hydrolase